ncbi:MAG: hypothetical protein EA424_05795, partial [Planctomycetaceae bacterium]
KGQLRRAVTQRQAAGVERIVDVGGRWIPGNDSRLPFTTNASSTSYDWAPTTPWLPTTKVGSGTRSRRIVRQRVPVQKEQAAYQLAVIFR